MRVVLLMGPSSVGKSTLCDELVKTHGWKTASLDEASLLMDRKSDLIKLKPELDHQVRLSGLSDLMSEKEILNLCIRSKLRLSREPHVISDYQFPNPQLPGLEEVLKSAGFDESESETLSKKMRKVVESGLDMPVYMLYDNVFSVENENETVVVDIFPLPNGVLPVLEDFHERAAKFQKVNPDISLTTHTVLAYCPPQFLSSRIQERNRRAEQEGNLGNQRVGIFPFEQLSTVLTATARQTTSSSAPQHPLAKNELFDIVKKHGTSSADSPLFIEETVDPSILSESQTPDDKAVTDIHDGRVTLVNEDDLSQPLTTEALRIGTAEEIKKYRGLLDKLEFSGYKTAMLSIRHREAYDTFIDMSKSSAELLAATLVTELDLLAVPTITPGKS